MHTIPLLNYCQGCTMCCKLLGVKELAKPVNKWCDHCSIGTGCKVYDDRPPTCIEYKCVWLQSKEDGHDLPDNLRPDRSKVVVSATMDDHIFLAHVDPARPNAWREGDMAHFLGVLSVEAKAKVIVSFGTGREKKLLNPTPAGIVEVRSITMTEPDENGVQHYEGK